MLLSPCAAMGFASRSDGGWNSVPRWRVPRGKLSEHGEHGRQTYWPIAPERRSPIEARRERRACLGPGRKSLMETLRRPGHIRDERRQADNRKEYEMPTLLTRR